MSSLTARESAQCGIHCQLKQCQCLFQVARDLVVSGFACFARVLTLMHAGIDAEACRHSHLFVASTDRVF